MKRATAVFALLLSLSVTPAAFGGKFPTSERTASVREDVRRDRSGLLPRIIQLIASRLGIQPMEDAPIPPRP